MKFSIDALRAVLDYLWEEEEDYRDYEDRDDPDSSGHIFLELQKLRLGWNPSDSRLS